MITNLRNLLSRPRQGNIQHMSPQFEALVLEIILSLYELTWLHFPRITNDATAWTNPNGWNFLPPFLFNQPQPTLCWPSGIFLLGTPLSLIGTSFFVTRFSITNSSKTSGETWRRSWKAECSNRIVTFFMPSRGNTTCDIFWRRSSLWGRFRSIYQVRR